MTQEDWPTPVGSPSASSKDDGKRAFIENRFSDALGHYLTAIDEILTTSSSTEGASSSNSSSSNREHQILLSNVVACRLKIGGIDMIEKAVEEAKKCVALNPQWSKAHVRLASAYIALGGHSNDACLSLQRALSLDRTNKVAREMLVKEMRRRTMEQSGGNTTSSSSSSSSTTTTNSDDMRRQHDFRGDGDQATNETSHRIYPDASAPPSPSHTSSESAPNNNHQSSHDGIDIDDTEPPSINVQQHNSLSSLSQRIQHYIARCITWFYSQSEDFQTLIMVSFFFLVLYVALGGRFGLGGTLPPAGNYGKGNAYERYSSSSRRASSSFDSSYSDDYQDGRGGRRTTTTSHSNVYNDRTNPQNDKYYSRYGNTDDYYYESPRRGRQQNGRGGYTNFPNLLDGSLISMTILVIGGMICHRFGVNPFQVLMMLNLLNRRGGGGGVRFGYGAYPGGGFGGFGGGFGRQRYRFGRRGGRGGGYW